MVEVSGLGSHRTADARGVLMRHKNREDALVKFVQHLTDTCGERGIKRY